MIPAALRRTVVERAGSRCEYCGMHQENSVLSFHVEHVLPLQHRGTDAPDNLALACPGCNLHKGPNLTGIDPDTGEAIRLFHPRKDVWSEHFCLENFKVLGLTPVGRTTVWLLSMNTEEQVRLRSGE